MMNTGIYVIQNKVNWKRYIGSAVNIKRRWSQHRDDLKKNKHGNSILQRSWSKYGEESFSFSVLLVCGNADLTMYEQLALDAMKPEYNIRKIAESNLGTKRSAEQRKRLGDSRRGRPISNSHKLALLTSHLGKTQSEETKEKIRASLLGRKHSDERRANLRASKTNISEETKSKIRASLLGRKRSKESIEKQRLTYYANQASKEAANV